MRDTRLTLVTQSRRDTRLTLVTQSRRDTRHAF